MDATQPRTTHDRVLLRAAVCWYLLFTAVLTGWWGGGDYVEEQLLDVGGRPPIIPHAVTDAGNLLSSIFGMGAIAAVASALVIVPVWMILWLCYRRNPPRFWGAGFSALGVIAIVGIMLVSAYVFGYWQADVQPHACLLMPLLG